MELKTLLTICSMAMGGSGCATLPPQQVLVPGPTVYVPTPVKCLKKEDRPALPVFPLDAPELREEGVLQAARIVRAAEAERLVRGQYVKTVEAVLDNCTEVKSQSLEVSSPSGGTKVRQ